MSGDKFRVEVEGLREFRRALRDLPADLRKEMKTEINTPIAEALYRRAVPLTPVGKTGKLVRSIGPLVAASYAGAGVKGSIVPYAAFVHWGANGWPKARGREAKRENRRKKSQKKRQDAFSQSASKTRVAGSLFLWKAAKQMTRSENSEALKMMMDGVRKAMDRIEAETNRASRI